MLPFHRRKAWWVLFKCCFVPSWLSKLTFFLRIFYYASLCLFGVFLISSRYMWSYANSKWSFSLSCKTYVPEDSTVLIMYLRFKTSLSSADIFTVLMWFVIACLWMFCTQLPLSELIIKESLKLKSDDAKKVCIECYFFATFEVFLCSVW